MVQADGQDGDGGLSDDGWTVLPRCQAALRLRAGMKLRLSSRIGAAQRRSALTAAEFSPSHRHRPSHPHQQSVRHRPSAQGFDWEQQPATFLCPVMDHQLYPTARLGSDSQR